MNLNEVNLPSRQLVEGSQVAVTRVHTETEYTRPPDYLQESELIALMDQHGIGTDASIPQHIKNVCDRHYVDVCGPMGEDGSRGPGQAPQHRLRPGKGEEEAEGHERRH